MIKKINKLSCNFFLITIMFVLFVSFVSAQSDSYSFIKIDKGSFCIGNYCLFGFIERVIEVQEPKLCYRLIGNERERKCFSEVAPEIIVGEKCEDFKEVDDKRSCYISVAELNKDVSYCNKITGEEYRKYSCFSAVAVATLNKSLCRSSTCMLVIASEKNNPDICMEIPNRNFIEDVDPYQSPVVRCLLITAERNNNTEICRLLTNQKDVTSCFRSIAIHTQDITLCKYLKDTSGVPKVTECMIINEEKICKEKETFLSRTDDYKILNCYSLIANDDFRQCDKVSDDSMKLRNACYYEMSRLNNDPSICKNIIIPMIEDVTCEKYVINSGSIMTEPF